MASMPRAMPLTTTAAGATPAARIRAASAPYDVWLRLPTIATAGRASSATSPHAYRCAGASGISRKSGGNAASSGSSTTAPSFASWSSTSAPRPAPAPRIAVAAALEKPCSAAIAPWGA